MFFFFPTKINIAFRFGFLDLYQFSIVMNRKLKLDELQRDSLEEFKSKSKHKVVVVLDNIRSLNNVGSFFRTCDAFNVEKLVLCGITAKPPHKDIHKTALGSTETVDWEYVENTLTLVEKLKAKKIIIATGYYEVPRYLEITGETMHHVSHYYDEAFRYSKMKAVIVGGANSAI